MKKNSNLTVYIIAAILVIGVVYTACKEITPQQTQVSKQIEIKLSK